MARKSLLQQQLEADNNPVQDIIGHHLTEEPAPAPAQAPTQATTSMAPAEISVKDCLYSMTIRMPDAWKEDLEQAANAEGIDMSNYVVRAVGDLLRANNPSLPQVEKTRRRNIRTRR